MKKLLIFLIIPTITSCTQNSCSRKYGRTTVIDLPENKKLVTATWKDDDLWLLTSEMDSSYIPKTHKFQEKSSYGILEGTIIIKESREISYKPKVLKIGW